MTAVDGTRKAVEVSLCCSWRVPDGGWRLANGGRHLPQTVHKMRGGEGGAGSGCSARLVKDTPRRAMRRSGKVFCGSGPDMGSAATPPFEKSGVTARAPPPPPPV